MNAQELEWNDLRWVLAVGRAGTLSGAARVLGVNHSTVFRRIDALEHKLGVRLFERLPTGYALTEAGEAMVASAERVETEVYSLSRKLIGRDLRLSGRLRVTAPDGLAMNILMPLLKEFHRAYPDIHVELFILNDFLNLSNRETDVAVRVTRQPPQTAMGRRLCTLASAIYGAPEYLDEHPETRFDDHTWIMPSASLEQWPATHWLRRHHPHAPVALSCNTVLGLFEAARQGLGIAPLPCFSADLEPGLVRLRPPVAALASELWLLSHPDLRQSARVRAFMDYLTPALAPLHTLIEGHAKDR